MLTRNEWNRTAERAAAAKYGERYAGLFAFRRFLAGPLGIAAVVFALTFGAYWIWTALADAVSAPARSAPTAYWVTVGILVAATAVTFRPRLIPVAAHLLIVRMAVAVLLWLGVIVFGVTAYVI